MTDLELIFAMLGEASTKEIAVNKDVQGFGEKTSLIRRFFVMKNKLKKQITDLAKDVLEAAKKEFHDANYVDRKKEQYKKLQIAPNIFISFQKWADNYRKPYLLILWYGHKYVMEMDLSRVVFNSDSTLTWVLNRPASKKNREIFKDLGYELTEVDTGLVEIMHKQMSICNKRARKTPRGYCLGVDITRTEAINKYLEIVEYSVKTKQGQVVNKSNYDLSVLEGQIQESRLLGKTRNREIVKQRKIKDNNTCQACGYSKRVNDLYVVECHHKNPLLKETITSIEDLVCLCPNCHRIAHTRKKPFTVEEIKRFV
jgi:5-methylcytosine-specific restriction protein A